MDTIIRLGPGEKAILTFKPWNVYDAESKGVKFVTLPAGMHRVREIPSPFDGKLWLVVEVNGQLIGAKAEFWHLLASFKSPEVVFVN